MIESERTNELRGQMELGDVLAEGTGNSEQGTGIPEGYDAEGHLLNVDYPPIQKPSPSGEGGSAQALTEEVDPTGIPQTSAQDEARLAVLATEINTITEQARGAVISAALAVGKRLIEARSLCPEGRFGEWLAASVSYSERKAQDMMRLYVEYGRDGAIPDSIAALDYSKAVALLSAPAEQRDALAAQAVEEGLSVRQLQQEIKRLKDEAAQAQQQIEWHENMKERLDNNINEVENNLDEVERQLEAKDDELKAAKRVIADAAEKVSLANAKAAAAEASAEALRKLHSDAEDRAAKSAQRASDAVNRANQVAKDLAEARAKIAALSEAAAAAAAVEPERVEVEVIPEETRREIEQLRRDLAEARANAQGTGNREQGTGMAQVASATEKFKWFYSNQMKPTFTTALNLLKEVALEDGRAADAFATAITNACKVLMNQIGTKEE